MIQLFNDLMICGQGIGLSQGCPVWGWGESGSGVCQAWMVFGDGAYFPVLARSLVTPSNVTNPRP